MLRALSESVGAILEDIRDLSDVIKNIRILFFTNACISPSPPTHTHRSVDYYERRSNVCNLKLHCKPSFCIICHTDNTRDIVTFYTVWEFKYTFIIFEKSFYSVTVCISSYTCTMNEFQALSVIVTFQALQMRKLPAPIMTRPPMNPKAMVSPRTRLAGKFSRPFSSSAKR